MGNGLRAMHSADAFLKMVGTERFEPINTLAQLTKAQGFNELPIMPHTSKSIQTLELPSAPLEELKRELEQADKRRRHVLATLFIAHKGDVFPILLLLFADARPQTLHTAETLLTTGGLS
jgi:hypothetical protein